jgi:hypothetical protein
MDVYVIPLTVPERALVRRAVEAYEPQPGKPYEQERRQSVLELLERPISTANTEDYINPTGGQS